jgi:hypothetical protein
MGDVMTSARYRDLWTARLAPGDTAFDFELPLLAADGSGVQVEGRMIRLSSFAGKRPVALIFGSYT